MSKLFYRWMVGALLLLGSMAANAEADFHFESFLTADTGYQYSATQFLNGGDYQVTLADYEFPSPLTFLGLGVFNTDTGYLNIFFTPGAYALSGLEAGDYTFYVYGAPDETGIGSFGVTVSAVPEPNMAFMLLIGLGLLMGYTSRRRSASIINTADLQTRK